MGDLARALVRGAQFFRQENGYLPRLAFPISFNEHIFARKYFAPLPKPWLADRLAAKDYVQALLGDGYLPAVAWVGDNIRGLFRARPPAGRYVLKTTHRWNTHLFVNLPEDLSARRDEIAEWARRELASRFGYDWGEWQYSTFEPRIFLEQFIDFNGDQTPHDYKFLCFRGTVRVIEVDIDRFTRPRSALYMPEWEYVPVNYGASPVQLPRPGNLKDMIRVAETVARGMDFVRVDLYSDGISDIRFGEITFTPSNACSHFSDSGFDRWLGSLFNEGS